METIETLLKLLGLFIFYGLVFLFGMTIFMFVVAAVAIRYLFSLFGRKEILNEIREEKVNQDVYGHETTIIYKKEEYQALVMYYVEEWSSGPVIEIVSVASPTEDFTDLLSNEEMARLRVEIEYNHVS